MSPRAKRKAIRKSLEVQVRELRNEVKKISQAVDQLEMLVMRGPCWAWVCGQVCGLKRPRKR